MKRSRSTIKNWFKTGLKPTEVQFSDWIDSFWHLDDELTAADISDLQGLLDAKISTVQKGVANGVCPLGSDVKIDAAYIPSLSIIDIIISSETSLANYISNEWSSGSIQKGDVVQITDADSSVQSWQLYTGDGSSESHYKIMNVSKVNWGNILNKPNLLNADGDIMDGDLGLAYDEGSETTRKIFFRFSGGQWGLYAKASDEELYYKNIRLAKVDAVFESKVLTAAIDTGVLNLNLSSLQQAVFTTSGGGPVAASSDFEVTLSNATNRRVYNFTLNASAGVVVSFPSTFKSFDSRWNSTTQELTLISGLYEISIYYDGTNDYLKVSLPYS